MKQHALWFVNCDTTELWEILPDVAAATEQGVSTCGHVTIVDS